LHREHLAPNRSLDLAAADALRANLLANGLPGCGVDNANRLQIRLEDSLVDPGDLLTDPAEVLGFTPICLLVADDRLLIANATLHTHRRTLIALPCNSKTITITGPTDPARAKSLPQADCLDKSGVFRLFPGIMDRLPRRIAGLLLLGVLALMSGCTPSRWLPKIPPQPEVRVKSVAAPEVGTSEPRPVKSILALSGGGSYGAYTAGVLNGWSRSNNRPEFDVVTGISTGALIAPMAFLGPKYDTEMRHFYTEVRRRDVFALRNLVTVPFRDAIATTAPLRHLVEAGITEQVVQEIAGEHKKGRRLYIATTNLQSRKTVVWDLGAMAVKNGPDTRRLIIDVLVASAAVPGVFPPVPIRMEENGQQRTELHVDGGVTTPVFVPTSVLENAKDADLFVILSHKPYPDAGQVKPRVLRVLGASGAALIHAHARSDISNLYYRAVANGLKFRMVALRQDFDVNDSAIEFDQSSMTKLFVEGVRVGVAGPVWDSSPLETGPGEDAPIRTGNQVGK
jgi:predicted acylesterase/phospholipase RssA